MKIFLDSVGGGAWPFLVGGVICLGMYQTNSDGSGNSNSFNLTILSSSASGLFYLIMEESRDHRIAGTS